MIGTRFPETDVDRVAHALAKRREWEADRDNIPLAMEWVALEMALTDSEIIRYNRLWREGNATA